MAPSSIEPGEDKPKAERSWWYHSFLPFRKAIVRGLAIVMPPLLTIVLFLWAWNIIESYVLVPVEATARHLIVWSISDVREDREVIAQWNASPRNDNRLDLTADPPTFVADDSTPLVKINQQWIPGVVFDLVETAPGNNRPETASAYYHRYVELEFLPRHLVIPAFLSVFVLALYLLGRLFAFGLGRLFWGYMEALIGRLPIVSNVYSSVKQVTDFAFSENELQFTRVVAVEYPRRGLWTIGFVTGESMLDIQTAANEPVVSVLMPTSPMPATGFVISVPKSQTIDLDMTMDQAIQWCVSCGVVVPTQQQNRTISANGSSLPLAVSSGPGSRLSQSESENENDDSDDQPKPRVPELPAVRDESDDVDR